MENSNNILRYKTPDGEIRVFDKSRINEVESLLVLRQHHAKPWGETKTRRAMPGEIYKQAGIEKAELILHGQCSLDLNAKIPKSNKRVAPKPGEEKYITPAGFYELRQLQKKVTELTTQLETLIKQKK